MEDKLIIAVSSIPILYDPSLECYRNTEQKNYAWRRVAEIVKSIFI